MIIIFAGVAGGMARSVVYGNVEVGASQMIAAMVPGIILAIVGGILMFIFEILLLVRMARLWSYDGKSVGPLDGMGAAPNQYGVPDYDNGQTYGGSQNYGGEQDYDDGQSHDGSHDFGGAQKFGDNQDQYDSPDFDEDQYYGSESESNEEE